MELDPVFGGPDDLTETCNEGGTWGIVVVVAAFSLQVLTFGTAQSIGVYNVEFLRYFDAGAAAVSLVGAINLGIFLGAGPIASLLMSFFSHRQVVLLGAALTNIGLIFMPFATNLPYMYVFYGVITGLGNCLVYVPSHVLSGLYFYKHRSLATGVATAGSGLGATVFPVIMYQIINEYGWQGSLFIVAGLNLHLFIFGALLRPVPKNQKEKLKFQEDMMRLGKSDNKKISSDDYSNEIEPLYHRDDLKVNKQSLENMSEKHLAISNGESGGKNEQKCSESDPLDAVVFETSVESSEKITLKKQGSKYGSLSQRLSKHFKSVFILDYVVYWVSNVCWNAGVAILLLFFAEYAVMVGLDKEHSSWVLSMEGAGSCIGCVLGGLLGNIKMFNREILYILGNIGCGGITILVTWTVAHSLGGLLTVSFVFGVLFGIILGLLVVVTADLLGMEALGHGFGYLMLANGIGVFSGPPLAGLLIDAYGDMNLAIYFSGVLTLFGGIVMSIVPVRRYFSRSC